jgi:hypothetical protein
LQRNHLLNKDIRFPEYDGPSSTPKVRLIAYYLPQFHPIPENDEWWGQGFTEWTNVKKARPLFEGHVQPRLPGELGFYDLRDHWTREAQVLLAREAGVEGFCYWHYWFGNGRRILERVFEDVLQSGRPNFPFCLAWANESWTGIWHGSPKSVLIEQTYPGQQDEEAHFNLVVKAFQDDRYIRVDAKPLFLIYKPTEMPDASAFISRWRHLAAKAGLPGLYFVGMSNQFQHPSLRDFDAVTHHVPGNFLDRQRRSFAFRTQRRLASGNFGPFLNKLISRALQLPLRYPYDQFVEQALLDLPDTAKYIPCVLPNWDNTPRSEERGLVLENASPDLFAVCLQKAIQRAAARPEEQRIVFLKSWNEWAEGNYVEPDAIYGRAWLNAIKSELFARI